jgi:hypothetical protein
MTSIRCPHCGKSLAKIARDLNHLARENNELTKLNRELADERVSERWICSQQEATHFSPSRVQVVCIYSVLAKPD